MAECEIFQGYIAPDGYGRVKTTKHGTRYAHRVAYMLHHGVQLADGEVVRHLCDNRSCVAVAHLVVGTQADNVQDCVSRSRRAEARYGPWLTQAQLEMCLSQYVPRSHTAGPRALGRLLGVPSEVVSKAIRTGVSPTKRDVPPSAD